jgi:ribosomal protein S24E
MSKLKIFYEKENKLFDRKEVQASVNTEITPSKSEILEILSKEFSKPLENIEVKKIQGKFGSKEFIINANIYDSEENKNLTERKSKKKKVEKK